MPGKRFGRGGGRHNKRFRGERGVEWTEGGAEDGAEGGAEGGKRGYSSLKRENPMFEEYYKQQGIVKPEEWDQFITVLRQPLAATFRLTGTRQTARDLLHAIETHYFPKLTSIELDGERIEPPRALPWYPDRLAWHMDFSRHALRRAEPLNQFHKFIVSENEQGHITRQEAVSMIPPLLLDVQPHHKVLDMCAAPGSKTTQLIEALHAGTDTIPSGLVVANDADNKRCYMLVHQTKRLQSPSFVITNQDASMFPLLYLDPKPGSTEKELLVYDRILCDVPCSGDGTLRKNPNAWTRWNPNLGNGLHSLQFRIAERGIQLLAVGGLMVYSTCSFNPIENEAVVAALLQKYPDALELIDVSDRHPELAREPGLLSWMVSDKKGALYPTYEGLPDDVRAKLRKSLFAPPREEAAAMHLERCLRILPHKQDTGGFFVALLLKKAETSKRERRRNEAAAAATAAAAPTTGASAAEEGEDKAEAEAAAAEAAAALRESLGGEGAGDDAGEEVGAGAGAGPADSDEDGDGEGKGDDKAQGDQESRKRIYKEDPFYFLNGENPHVRSIREYYGLRDDFPFDLFLTRSLTEKSRNIYLVSPLVKQIINNNDQAMLRIINTGVKVMTRSEADAVDCGYRICHEGLQFLFPFLTKRVFAASRADALLLLTRDVPSMSEFSSPLKEELQATVQGTCVLAVPPVEGEQSAPLPFLGWRGHSTLRCLVAKPDRHHYKLLLGQEPQGDLQAPKPKPPRKRDRRGQDDAAADDKADAAAPAPAPAAAATAAVEAGAAPVTEAAPAAPTEAMDVTTA